MSSTLPLFSPPSFYIQSFQGLHQPKLSSRKRGFTVAICMHDGHGGRWRWTGLDGKKGTTEKLNCEGDGRYSSQRVLTTLLLRVPIESCYEIEAKN